MKCEKPKQTFLITILICLLAFAIFPAQATFTLKQNVILKTSANNAQFVMGFNAELYKLEVNSTHLWIDKQYTAKHYTEYCLGVESPSDTQFVIDSWFDTANSSAQLTIISPLATDIHLHFSSPNLLIAYAQNAVNYTWIVANQTLCMYVNTAISSSFIISATVSETEYNHSPENVDVEITDMEGCGNWVFSQTKYYSFTAKFWDGDGYTDLSECKIAFTDGSHWANISYSLSTQILSLDNGSDIVQVGYGTYVIIDANEIEITFPIQFKNTVLDADDVDLYMKCIDISGVMDGWELIKSGYFNIYNLGGHSTLATVGDAGRIVGGDVFDLYCGNMSSVEATMMIKDWQHVKMLPTFQTFGSNYGLNNITFFVEYCVGDVWVRAFSIVLTPSLAYRPDILGGTCVRWNWTATYYELGTQIKSEKFWCYFQNYNETQSTLDTQLWVDLWFNQVNASTVWGARVNAYYYPMVDNSNFWLRWLSGSNWGVDERLVKQSECFGTLRDDDGNIISTLNLKLVRIGCNMTTGNIWAEEPLPVPFIAKVQQFVVFDLTVGSEPLHGVQTPPWDETKIPTMAQGGLLGSVWTTLQNLGGIIGTELRNALWNAFAPSISIVAGILGAIFSYVGLPNPFPELVAWLQNGWFWMVASLGYCLTLLTSFFAFLATFMVQLIAFISEAFQWWGTTFTVMGSFLAGGYGTGVNIWTTYNIPQWITLGLILYPIYLVFLWEEKGLGAVIDQITFIYNTLHLMFYVFLTVIDYVSSMVTRLIELIPIAE